MFEQAPCPKCGAMTKCSFEVAEELRFTCYSCDEHFAVDKVGDYD